MSTIAEIESAVARLDQSQLFQFSKWFDEFLENAWDEQMERDVKAGKFDKMKAEVERARKAGELIDFP
jgi:hypothetical protein